MKSGLGKNNFDRLEAAGLVAGSGDPVAALEAKLKMRMKARKALAKKLKAFEAALANVCTLARRDQVKRLEHAANALRTLYASPLPLGTKTYVATCVNEVQSLVEGASTARSALDQQTLTLLAVNNAVKCIEALATTDEVKLTKLDVEASDESESAVIDKYRNDNAKLEAIKSKPFIVTRVPVIPTDSAVSLSKLIQYGFKAEALSQYTVLPDQMVIGINPKFLDGSANTSELVRKELARLQKILEKRTNSKLQLVSQRAYSYGSGTWFWLMKESELNMFAKAFPASHVKVNQWGFAFN